MRAPALLLAFALLAPAALAAPVPLAPRVVEGPTVPSTTAPIAVVKAFVSDRWSFTEGSRTVQVAIPTGWDRVVLNFTANPTYDPDVSDPWDRLFAVGLDGTEVLHGTTPRADMTIRRDVTEYASLLRDGQVNVTVFFGTWVGNFWISASLELYDDDATETVAPKAHARIASPFLFRGLGAPGSSATRTMDLGASAPAHAQVELWTSGHSPCGEFWYTCTGGMPIFILKMDGEEIGRVVAMPYVYALAGIGAANSIPNRAIWWTAPQAMELAGVRTGIGTIPPYRMTLTPDVVERLHGERTFTLEVFGGSGGYWPTSVTLLMD